MKTHEHFLIGFVFCGLLFFTGLTSIENIVLIFIGNFIFDIDHMLYYFMERKRFEFRKYMQEQIRLYNIMETKLYVFHSLEFIIILMGLSIFWGPVGFLLLGYMLHCICDWVRAAYHYRNNLQEFFKWTRYWLLIWNIDTKVEERQD